MRPHLLFLVFLLAACSAQQPEQQPEAPAGADSGSVSKAVSPILDAPDAMARYRSAITETAGFYRTSGFIDDTRAFLSIPARHDTARRADAAFLARLVAEGRVPLRLAERIADDLVSAIPREAFKL